MAGYGGQPPPRAGEYGVDMQMYRNAPDSDATGGDGGSGCCDWRLSQLRDNMKETRKEVEWPTVRRARMRYTESTCLLCADCRCMDTRVEARTQHTPIAAPPRFHTARQGQRVHRKRSARLRMAYAKRSGLRLSPAAAA